MTPMMQQYFEVKNQYKDFILFYRLGDFYEMFFEDAQILICRPDASVAANALACCIKGGHNGVPHNHNDAGGYEVAVDGVRMVADPGLQKYDVDTFGPKRYESKMRNSYGHDVPVVAGEIGWFMTDEAAKVNPVLAGLPKSVPNCQSASGTGFFRAFFFLGMLHHAERNRRAPSIRA